MKVENVSYSERNDGDTVLAGQVIVCQETEGPWLKTYRGTFVDLRDGEVRTFDNLTRGGGYRIVDVKVVPA